jgi:phage-related protein
MRVAETVVDGVDGSIIEELGYASYDKTLTIGLTRNADINEVIEYFTGSGDVVFSNEADKYYKASIINQIDYARLVRFRVATVTFRVQPFKYGYLEENAILPNGELTGEVIELADVILTKLAIDGRSIQNGTPAPESPVGISSLNEIELEISNGVDVKTTELTFKDPIRSMPNGVKDIAYLKGDKMFVDRYIGYLVLDGTENWTEVRKDTTKVNHMYQIDIKQKLDNKTINVMSNCFVGYNADDLWMEDLTGITLNLHGNIQIGCEIGTVAEFKSWLAGNKVIVLYKLQSPYTEEIGEVTYLELLEGENTISNSENATMTASYIDREMLVNNVGNYIAKPVIEIKGAGTIDFTLNGNKVFRYTFPENEDTVVIDSQKQDAYLGAVLKNRNMSGEFPVFAIGENTITWEGYISSIRASSKSRWL